MVWFQSPCGGKGGSDITRTVAEDNFDRFNHLAVVGVGQTAEIARLAFSMRSFNHLTVAGVGQTPYKISTEVGECRSFQSPCGGRGRSDLN